MVALLTVKVMEGESDASLRAAARLLRKVVALLTVKAMEGAMADTQSGIKRNMKPYRGGTQGRSVKVWPFSKFFRVANLWEYYLYMIM